MSDFLTEKNKKAVIDGASSFTAFYHVRSFIPGNYDSRKIVWKKDGMEEGLPVGTSIIMTERSEERSTTDFWYYKVQILKSQKRKQKKVYINWVS